MFLQINKLLTTIHILSVDIGVILEKIVLQRYRYAQ